MTSEYVDAKNFLDRYSAEWLAKLVYEYNLNAGTEFEGLECVFQEDTSIHFIPINYIVSAIFEKIGHSELALDKLTATLKLGTTST